MCTRKNIVLEMIRDRALSFFFLWCISTVGLRGDTVEALSYKPEGLRVRFFSLTLLFWPHCGTWVDSATNRNEYYGYQYSLQVSRADNPDTFICRLSRNFGSLDLLDP